MNKHHKYIRNFDDLYNTKFRKTRKNFGKKFDEEHIILSEDVNTNLVEDKSLPLIEFLNQLLGFTISNDRKLNYKVLNDNRCGFYTIFT